VLGGRKNCPDSISEKPIFSFSLIDAENFVTRPKQGFRSGDMRVLHKKSADQIILISNSVFQNRVRHQQKAGVLYASACQHEKSCLNVKRYRHFGAKSRSPGDSRSGLDHLPNYPIRSLQHIRGNLFDFGFAILDFRLLGHRITLSALAKTLGGIVNPICLAVLRLMTSSNFVGCSTGRSAGFAPFRILST
jgi:hypothetical protein